MEENMTKFNNLEDLPSLREGWIRLVHRCESKSIGKDTIQSIKENGLVFNRSVTDILPSQRGGSYPSPGYMASIYTEDLFWEKLIKDDFLIFDDAKYADTQIVFDMPLDELCFLEKFGRVAIGKIDKKYIVGVIPNYNGYNKKLIKPKDEILKAKEISKNNPPSEVTPNSLDTLVSALKQRFKTITKETVINSIKRKKEYILDALNECLKEKTQPHIIQNKSAER